MNAAPLHGEFFRDENPIDRDFFVVRNWWVRDPKIAGNALSVYLFIRSQAPGYRVTQASVMDALQMGRTAFESARRKLIERGLLEVQQYVHPAGTVDELGRPIGGHRIQSFRLRDPHMPAELPSNTRQSSPQSGGREAAEVPVDKPMHEINVGFSEPVDKPTHEINIGFDQPEDGEPNARNQQWLDPRQDGAEASAQNQHWADAACGEPNARNPRVGFVHLKEDKDKENKDQSSSVNDVTPGAVAASPDDDDSDLRSWFVDLGAGLSKLAGVRVDARVVLERIARQHQSIPAFDLVAATLEVLTRARVSATPIKHRDGYVASSIAADLAGFVRRFPIAAVPVAAPAARPVQTGFGTTANAALRTCEERGHRFVVGPAHDQSCDRCGARELELQAERDVARKAAQHQCEASGHDWAQPTPHRVGTIAAGTILCRRCDVAASSTRQAVS